MSHSIFNIQWDTESCDYLKINNQKTAILQQCSIISKQFLRIGCGCQHQFKKSELEVELEESPKSELKIDFWGFV